VAGFGAARQVWHGRDGQGAVRQAWHGKAGKAWRGTVRQARNEVAQITPVNQQFK